MNENFRFFLFHYEKEIRVFIITVFLLGFFTWGKARFDQWQGSRFESWPTATATILDVEIEERLNRSHLQPTALYRAVLLVEYQWDEEWRRADVLVSRIPPGRLPLVERGRTVEIRVPSHPSNAPVFRWTDQRITLPTD